MQTQSKTFRPVHDNLLRGFMHLEPSNTRLHRLALHLAVSGVSAGADGFPDDHQIAAPLAQRFETSLAAAHRRRRCRNLGDLRPGGRGLRDEAADRFADDAVTFARPRSGGAVMIVPLFPPVGVRVRGGKRKARSALGLAVKNEVQRVVRVDAAAIARAVGRDLGNGIAAAIAAALLLRLAENEHGRALEHLAAGGHRVRGDGAVLLNTAVTSGSRRRRRVRRRVEKNDFLQNRTREFSRQRVHVLLEGVSAVRIQAESDGRRRQLRRCV